jgi:hypothetical protein
VVVGLRLEVRRRRWDVVMRRGKSAYATVIEKVTVKAEKGTGNLSQMHVQHSMVHEAKWVVEAGRVGCMK